jgi:hypothetical protein
VECEGGVGSLERDGGVGDGAMLGIVDYAVKRGEDGGERGKRCAGEKGEQ